MKPLYVFVLCVLAVGCGPAGSDEERIRARIQEMQSALAEGNTRAFVAPMAEDFTAATRDLDRRAARLLLRREMLAHERLEARLFDIEISVQQNGRATATLHAVTTGGSGLIPESAGWYRITTGWRLDDDEWVLISARWETVAGRG